MLKEQMAFRWTALTVCAIGLLAPANASAAKKDTPKPLPPQLVKDWKNAAAYSVGWMRLNRAGFVEFVDKKDAPPGSVPAFQLF
jgi:hypothetical protein